MFINSNASGNLCFFIGQNFAGTYDVGLMDVTFKNPCIPLGLLNAKELTGKVIRNDAGQLTAVLFDPNKQMPYDRLLIVKYKEENGNWILIDLTEDDRGAIPFVMEHYMTTSFADGNVRILSYADSINNCASAPEIVSDYKELSDKTKSEFLGNDIKNAAIIYLSISSILDVPDFKHIIDLYIFICVRLMMGMSLSRIVWSFEGPYKDIDTLTRERLITFVKLHLESPSLCCLTDFEIGALDQEIDRVNAHAQALESLSHPNDETYGLSPDNPIMVMSIPEAYIFIDKLIPDDGEIISHNRIGVIKSIMPDLVDGYEIKIKRNNGQEETLQLFIDPYAEKTFNKAPKGFTLRPHELKDSIKAFAHNAAALNIMNMPTDNKEVN